MPSEFLQEAFFKVRIQVPFLYFELHFLSLYDISVFSMDKCFVYHKYYEWKQNNLDPKDFGNEVTMQRKC